MSWFARVFGCDRRWTLYPGFSDPVPVELPPEVEVVESQWDVRFHGVKIGIVRPRGGRFVVGTASGFTTPGGDYRTRDEAVAALIREAQR
ncbi:MAG: hypothetical protein IPJ61_21620 [Tessaracoccus sp.]|uniref:hypothetical protein n=1 Tax=Tessaracoccus sp. TaxID=1971211 RepID=UPI001EBD8CC9|nr:hypothetical protein [Tessaracoccus sp.]MBK7823589.1 hypothetical protein [Tessaracoccus sp.]